MEIDDLRPGMLVRDGLTLLQISSVYPTYVTAQVLLAGRPSKAPSRTQVRHYVPFDIEGFAAPTKGLLAVMDETYSATRR
jgi:hypothetical protein